MCSGFDDAGEDELGVLAQYYDIPWLSFRGVTWHDLHAGTPGFAFDDIMWNGHHPNLRGHRRVQTSPVRVRLACPWRTAPCHCMLPYLF